MWLANLPGALQARAEERRVAAGTIQLAQTRKAWASELGLTHETLYRTLRHLQRQGIIRVDSKGITAIYMV